MTWEELGQITRRAPTEETASKMQGPDGVEVQAQPRDMPLSSGLAKVGQAKVNAPGSIP